MFTPLGYKTFFMLISAEHEIFYCKSYSHFFSKTFQHICVLLNVNFNESLANNVLALNNWALLGLIGLHEETLHS